MIGSRFYRLNYRYAICRRNLKAFESYQQNNARVNLPFAAPDATSGRVGWNELRFIDKSELNLILNIYERVYRSSPVLRLDENHTADSSGRQHRCHNAQKDSRTDRWTLAQPSLVCVPDVRDSCWMLIYTRLLLLLQLQAS